MEPNSNDLSHVDDVAALEPAAKRQFVDSGTVSTPSLNQKALDALLFDWSSHTVPNVAQPDWNVAVASYIASEKAKVPIHPRSAFETLQQSTIDE